MNGVFVIPRTPFLSPTPGCRFSGAAQYVAYLKGERTGVTDGVSLQRFRCGSVYDIGTQLASVLLPEGWAEPVDHMDACSERTTVEREEYVTDLVAVARLELAIVPSIDGGKAVATLRELRIA